MGEISPYEFMAREFERLAILRKMWSADEVAAIIRRYDIERGTGRDPTNPFATRKKPGKCGAAKLDPNGGFDGPTGAE